MDHIRNRNLVKKRCPHISTLASTPTAILVEFNQLESCLDVTDTYIGEEKIERTWPEGHILELPVSTAS